MVLILSREFRDQYLNPLAPPRGHATHLAQQPSRLGAPPTALRASTLTRAALWKAVSRRTLLYADCISAETLPSARATKRESSPDDLVVSSPPQNSKRWTRRTSRPLDLLGCAACRLITRRRGASRRAAANGGRTFRRYPMESVAGQQGSSPRQPETNESISPEFPIFVGYREYLLTSRRVSRGGRIFIRRNGECFECFSDTSLSSMRSPSTSDLSSTEQQPRSSPQSR